MRKMPNGLQVTPQQIKRYLKGYGFGSLTEAKDNVEQELHREVGDTSHWAGWAKFGLTKADMESDEAQAIASIIRSYEEDSLLLGPLEVRTWRENMGFSQPEAADFVGVVRATWSRWEQLGIIADGAGIAAHALAASIASQDPGLLSQRTQIVEKLITLYKKANRFRENSVPTAILISRHGEQGEEARLGLGSYGLYHLLRQAWETKSCGLCKTSNADNANFCAHCGFAFDSRKEEPQR